MEAVMAGADSPQALKGSDHLDFILQHRLYKPVSPKTVEDLYERIAPDAPDFTFVTTTQILENTAPEEKVILAENSHIEIAKVLEVPELSGEVERAVWQVGQGLNKERRPSQEKANPGDQEKKD